MKIDLLAVYERRQQPKIKFEYDKTSPKRPAWIKLINPKIKIGFLRIRINNTEEVVYRAFGNYFYPWGTTKYESKQFMARISEDYDSIVIKNNLPWAEKLAERLEKLGLKKNASIIDLGAGTGISSEAMANKGYQNLTLVDRSSEMLEIAKTKTKLHKAKFVVADVTKLKLGEKYNAVISVMLFDDFKPEETLEKVLIKVKKIIKPNGIIGLVTDTKESAYVRQFKKIEDGTTKDKSTFVSRYYFIGRKI